MAVTRQQLLDALVFDLDREIEAAEAEAKKNPHVFSDRFEKSMEEMIRTGRPDRLWSDAPENTNAKKKKLSGKGLRILLIAAAILLALTAVACAVPEIRESIAGFFVRIFSDHVEYVDPAITKERIEEEYRLDPIPDGFMEVSVQKTDAEIIASYTDGNNILKLQQSAGEYVSANVDSENGQFYEYTEEGIAVRVLVSDGFTQASWIKDGYYFSLSYYSNIDIDVIKEWIYMVNKQ